MSPRALAAAEASWEEFWMATRAVELTEAVSRHAVSLAGEHGLRGADAVHLASALAINDPEIVVAVWDSRLRDGARHSAALDERITLRAECVDGYSCQDGNCRADACHDPTP